MITDHENWQENADENQKANAENENAKENRYNRVEGYDANASDEQRPHRPASTWAAGASRGDRPQRPRFSRTSPANSERVNYNREERPSYNNRGEYGERTDRRPSYNSYNSYNSGNREEGGERRPYRQPYNREGGEGYNSYNNNNNYNRGYNRGGNGGYQRRNYNNNGYNNGGYNNNRGYNNGNDYNNGGYNNNRGYNNGNDYNNGGNGGYNSGNSYGNGGGYNNGGYNNRNYNNNGEERPHFRRPNNNYNNNYNNGGDEQRQRFNPNYGNRRPQNQPGGFRPRRTNDYNPNAKYSKKKQIEYKEEFVDPNEPIRLNKYLANAGVCSRREADEYITAGVVKVNGEVVTELGTKVKRGDEIMFHEQPVSIERKVYILLNKPKDCVTTSDDPQERKTVMDYVKDACKERIYPVGRLDRNTTGVLLLTNDGDLASKLTHPKFLKKKIYHVRLDKNLTAADMEQIAAGITLDDGEIHADEISYVSEDKSDIGIEIHSGKNRIVRRIFESLGYRVVKLDRVFFAGLTKKALRRGQWRYLTEKEVNMLRMGAFE